MQNRTIEDYCRTIKKLDTGDGVRSKDLVKVFKLSKNTISITLKRLANSGFIKRKPYGKIRLSKKGVNLAKKMNFKHRVLESFLFKLKLNKKEIHKQACAIEHWVSDKTILNLYHFLGKPKFDPHGSRIILS